MTNRGGSRITRVCSNENGELGLAYMKEENFLEAIRYLERAMGSDDSAGLSPVPAVVSAYGLCVGIVRKQWSESIRLCRKAVEADALNIELYYNLGRAYLGAGRKADAVRALNQGLTINERHRAIRGLMSRMGDRRKPAIEFLPRSNGINRVLGKASVHLRGGRSITQRRT